MRAPEAYWRPWEDYLVAAMETTTKDMDRVGRVLFLLYHRNELFKERYGREGVEILEEAAREAFVALGNFREFLSSCLSAIRQETKEIG
jgi:hypothetical protein